MALLVDSLSIPAWAFRMVQLVLDGGKADIVLVVENGTSGEPSKSRFSKLLAPEQRRQFAYYLHRAIDKRLSGRGKDPFSKRDLRELLPDVEVKKALLRQTRFSDFFSPELCEEIRATKVDIAIRLGFRILRGEILSCPRYGVWSYHHGDEKVNRGGPPGFWEVLEGWPVTGVTLQILSEDLDGGKVLARTHSTTDPTFVARNKKTLYWNSAPLLPRMVEKLSLLGPKEFFDQVSETTEPGPRIYSKRLYRTPKNLEMAGLLARHLGRIAVRKVSSALGARRWMLFYCFNPEGGLSQSLHRFGKLEPPAGREWADPFIVSRNGQHYVFIEELIRERGKAHISCLSFSEKSGWSDAFPVLERDYHLSYPHVFEFDGEYYMIPESGENRTIELYKATDFPHGWEMVDVLMEGVRARDTTVLFQQGKWWMFTCLQEFPEMSSWQELFVFSSPSLLGGRWEPHPRNPVVSDARTARPAGAFFQNGTELYRPSQNCGGCYGSSLNINRVRKLSSTVYEEECVEELLPDWGDDVERVHTLSYCNGLTMVDALVVESLSGRGRA